MKKRVCSIIMALCMVIALLPITAMAVDSTESVTEQIDAGDDIQYVESVTIPDSSATNPKYATNSIFLNGNDAVISAAVTENSYTLQILVNGTTYTYALTNDNGTPNNVPSIFGGKYIGAQPSADVTVEGEQTITVDSSVQLYLSRYYPISRLLAGGAGDATAYGSRQEGTTYYKAVTEGTVTLNVAGYVSAIRGGGSGDSTVSNAVIDVSGQAYTVYGGGDAPYGTVANLTENGTTSTCHVGSAEIKITETGHATYVYGGGYSVASVGGTSIVVAGRAGTVTASGSNGYTGSCAIDITQTGRITPESGYPAVSYGWNGYGVGATVTNEGTINGDVVLGTLHETNSVSGASETMSFTNSGTVTGEAKFGNVGKKNIALSGDVTLSTEKFVNDVPDFRLEGNQKITFSDGATWTGEIQTVEGTVLSAETSNNGLTLSAVTESSDPGSPPVASVGGKTYTSLADAISDASADDTILLLANADLTSAIGKNVTINGNGKTLTVEDDGAVNANVELVNVGLTVASEGAATFLGSTGALTVQSDSTLTMLSTAMIGESGNLKLSSGGSVTMQMKNGRLNVTINGEAEIPSEKQWSTRMTTGAQAESAILMDVTIAEDAKLTVSSTGSTSAQEGNKYGLRVANDTTLTVLGELEASGGLLDVSNRGSIVIESSGSVTIGGTNDLYAGKITGSATVHQGGRLTVGTLQMVGAAGNLNVTSGTLTLDMENIANVTSPSIQVTLNGSAEVPRGKRWTTVMGPSGTTVSMAATIAQGSTLTVNGSSMTAGAESGLHVANGTTLTNNGTIAVNAHMTIGAAGTVAGSGTITVAGSGVLEINDRTATDPSTGSLANNVTNRGTVVYGGANNSGNLTGTITMASGGKVYSNADIANCISDEETMTGKTYDGVTYAYAWQYDAPSHDSDSGSTVTRYAVTVEAVRNGEVSVSPSRAAYNQTVTITVTPDEGYELSELVVTDRDGDEVTLRSRGDGRYTFTMPRSAVTVEAAFARESSVLSFRDVDVDDWYYNAVVYAVDNGIMGGYNAATFGPEDDLPRSQMVQVLYNLAGQPDLSGENLGYPYSDVPGDQWYANAVYWARLAGVAGGYPNNTFVPDGPVTRQEAAVMMRSYAQSLGYDVSYTGQPVQQFVDSGEIDSWAWDAMSWAVDAGVMGGKGGGYLDPTGTATRAEIAQIMMNFLEKVAG